MVWKKLKKTPFFEPSTFGGSTPATLEDLETPYIGTCSLKLLRGSPESLPNFVTDFVIDDDVVDWFPDIFCWTPMTIIHQRVRDFLEDIDPEGNIFLPTMLFTRNTRELVEGPHYQWKPARLLLAARKWKLDGRKRVLMPTVMGRFALDSYAWELTHNAELRAVLSEFPTFVIAPGYQIAFNASTFRRLKMAGFTGLNERDTLEWTDDGDINTNVGHFL